ncbi:septal ring lytic transglycosylase RlpA family protein [Phenylobacterium hankyongense]|uniref:septal ring lytic transglycosylase RlpA family protein n=1 Tax=Phenylobacterium hankyongense TaxID=1813876 RepID=UPI0024362C1E|nr:septal ring lytic transglycosylase RlpA family protein [Phenylobacterium hankyongense]
MDHHSFTRFSRLAVVLAAGASLAACATVEPRYATQPAPAPRAQGQKIGKPYQVGGVWYTPKAQPNYDEVGLASWYGPQHQGKPTANGERFDLNRVTAAHKTLPLPSVVEVTNLDNGKRIHVRVNDRGPFVSGRIIDLSQEAARELGFEGRGLAHVRVRYLGADAPPNDRTALLDARVDAPF